MSAGATAAVSEEATTVSRREYSGELLPHEIVWRDRQIWLEERGYMLRPRYRPGWVPSWEGTDSFYWSSEDGVRMRFSQLLDATRISDGAMVGLKRVSTKVHPHEVEISQMLSVEPLASDPRNHCVPIHEILQLPDSDDTVLLVMPLLRPYNDPQFETIGEVVEFLRQIFEGLQFMHSHRIAHRDCTTLNIMMDPRPMFPNMFHPQRLNRRIDFNGQAKHYTRTARPTKYYFIDFGLSRKYDPDEDPILEDPIRGGDKTVPEFLRSDQPCDPFPTDIYYLGNMIREDFLQKFYGLEFLQPLVDDMVQDDPTQRPTIDQIVTRFADQRATLGYWKLRSRLARPNEHWFLRIFRVVRHIFRTIGYIFTRRAPIPTP